jgi:hypothetical protein
MMTETPPKCCTVTEDGRLWKRLLGRRMTETHRFRVHGARTLEEAARSPDDRDAMVSSYEAARSPDDRDRVA